MTLVTTRIAATNKKLEEIKEARRTEEKKRRKAYKQIRAERQRKIMLVGEAVLGRLERGAWDDTEFREMMDEALTRTADRVLFDLD
ncbi:hypothetical protein AWV80_07065 [Cupriavidus sp. UYMU48A]|nr:hypothetical protein AWV80_07065 [Cupriavidus sp. UYMU48A]